MNAGCHADEQQLEMYSLGSLTEAEIAPLEEHLLICHDCQDLLAETDSYMTAMREAAQELRAESAAPRRSAWSRMLGWFCRPLPAVVFAGGCALLIMFLLHPGLLRPGAVPATVILQATRGDAPGEPLTAAGKPVRLRLDLAGVAPLPSFRLELADANGVGVAGSVVKAGRDGVVWDVSPLQAGRYWLRVYEPGSGGRLLREFALPVR